MSPIKFGAVLNVTPEFFNGNWLQLRNLVRECEKQGYDSVWLMDHLGYCPAFVRDNSITGGGPGYFECWTALTAIALSTSRIRIGPLVTCVAYRYPSVLAKMASTLDIISGGRLEFGIGAGWHKGEYEAYGIPFPEPYLRIRQLQEALTIIKKMWTEEKPTYKGEFYSIKELDFGPLPVQKPHPPIWIGGGGEKYLLKVVAEIANVWDSWTSVKYYEHKLEVLKSHCKDVGRDFNEIEKSTSPELIIAKSRKEAVAKAKKMKVPNVSLEQFLERRVWGTPEDCISKIEEYASIGVTRFLPMIHTMNTEDRMLFAEEVMSYFK